MGARYVLCGSAESPTDAEAKQMFEIEGYKLYENANPMSRLTLVHQVAGSAANVASFVEIIQRGFDYHSEAYVLLMILKASASFLTTGQCQHRRRM